MAKRACAFRHPGGHLCGAPPLHDGQYCLMHDPAHAAEVTEGRRLGGFRRRREVTLQGAYELASLRSVEGVWRLLDIAVLDALSLEASITRCRLLLQSAQVAARLLQTGDQEMRLRLIEAAVHPHKAKEAPSVFATNPFGTSVEIVEGSG